MKLFPTGHATHPQWRMAAALVLAQLRAQMSLPEYASAPTLGLLYITDHYASDARDILDALAAELADEVRVGADPVGFAEPERDIAVVHGVVSWESVLMTPLSPAVLAGCNPIGWIGDQLNPGSILGGLAGEARIQYTIQMSAGSAIAGADMDLYALTTGGDFTNIDDWELSLIHISAPTTPY